MLPFFAPKNCPNINKAHCTKTYRYSSLVSDIAGFNCSLVAVKVGSRGLIDADNKNRLTRLSKYIKIPVKFSEFKNKLTKLELMSSFLSSTKHDVSWNANYITFSPAIWLGYFTSMPVIGMDCSCSWFCNFVCSLFNKDDRIWRSIQPQTLFVV